MAATATVTARSSRPDGWGYRPPKGPWILPHPRSPVHPSPRPNAKSTSCLINTARLSQGGQRILQSEGDRIISYCDQVPTKPPVALQNRNG